MIIGILICLLVYAAYRFGWELAHLTIAKECKRLGAFYVGGTTFKCVAIESNPISELKE